MRGFFLVLLIALWLGGCQPADPRSPLGPTLPTLSPVTPIQAPSAKDVVAARPAVIPEPPAEEELDSSLDEDAESFGDEATEEDLYLLGAAPLFPDAEGDTVRREEVIFDLPVMENARVRYFLDLYSGPARGTFARWLERSGRYVPMMQKIFAEYGLPQDLAYLAMIESGFNSRAQSWAQALGPWQFTERTGRNYGLKGDWWLDERRDPEKSTHAAARYLRDLHQQFDGDWYLAVAAYNAGSGRIQGAIRSLGTRDFWELTRGEHLQQETRQFVPKLLAALMIAKEPEKYGFTNLDYLKPLAYDVAKLPSATDLEVVAELCGTTYEEIKALNPELKRWSTPPGSKNHALRIPPGSKERFTQAYAGIPANERLRYARHRVQAGDTLNKVAKQYNVRAEDILTLNRIENARALRVGSDLILPLKPGYTQRPVKELADDTNRTRRRTYTVKKGDSLWSIARRFEVSEGDLRTWNKLGAKAMLQPGQVLTVSAAPVRQPTKAPVASKAKAADRLVYTVKPGDTLWNIGRRYQVDARDIRDWNNLPQGHVLRPGDKLTLHVQPGQRG